MGKGFDLLMNNVDDLIFELYHDDIDMNRDYKERLINICHYLFYKKNSNL